MANATYDRLAGTSLFLSLSVRDMVLTLIDEEKFSYSLDSIAKKYLKKGKKEDGLQNAADTYGINAKSDMWKLPARHVGKYAEADARLTYDAYQKQIPILREQGLWQVWELECELIPVLVYMSMQGVPVDLDAAEQFNKDLKVREVSLLDEFKNLDIWSPQQLGKYIESLGLKVPRTEKGNYSVAKDFLNHCEHPQVKKIQEARSINRLRKVFIEDIILNQNHNGRIHADFDRQRLMKAVQDLDDCLQAILICNKCQSVRTLENEYDRYILRNLVGFGARLTTAVKNQDFKCTTLCSDSLDDRSRSRRRKTSIRTERNYILSLRKLLVTLRHMQDAVPGYQLRYGYEEDG